MKLLYFICLFQTSKPQKRGNSLTLNSIIYPKVFDNLHNMIGHKSLLDSEDKFFHLCLFPCWRASWPRGLKSLNCTVQREGERGEGVQRLIYLEHYPSCIAMFFLKLNYAALFFLLLVVKWITLPNQCSFCMLRTMTMVCGEHIWGISCDDNDHEMIMTIWGPS